VLWFIRRLRSAFRGRFMPVFYDPRYRLPLSGIEASAGLDPRRADSAAWWLRSTGLLKPRCFRTPRRATFEELGRVHTPEHLESLSRPESLAALRPDGQVAVVDLALPYGRAAALAPLARLACAAGGSDPYRHPWLVAERDGRDVRRAALRGGHVQVVVARFG